MSHYRVECSVCGTTITQCRCPAPDKERRLEVCKRCQAIAILKEHGTSPVDAEGTTRPAYITLTVEDWVAITKVWSDEAEHQRRVAAIADDQRNTAWKAQEAALAESTALRSRLADVVKIAEEAIGDMMTAYDYGKHSDVPWETVKKSQDEYRARLSSLTPGGDRGT